MPPGERQPFNILFVCTGNVCRSPTAQFMLLHLLGARLDDTTTRAFSVSSAGTAAVTGAAIDPGARAQLPAFGVPITATTAFVARDLSLGILAQADLVLTAEPQHRAEVVQCAPRLLRRAFCIREFAALLTTCPASSLPSHPTDRAHTIAGHASESRGLAPPLASEDLDVPDPIGRSEADYRRAADLIYNCVDLFVDMLST